MTWSDLAQQYADAITEAGTVKAYADPQKAANNRPCILVGLPTADYTATLGGSQPELTWPFVALASKDTGALSTLHEVQALVEAVVDVFDPDGPVRPVLYPLGSTRVPAYVVTVTL